MVSKNTASVQDTDDIIKELEEEENKTHVSQTENDSAAADIELSLIANDQKKIPHSKIADDGSDGLSAVLEEDIDESESSICNSTEVNIDSMDSHVRNKRHGHGGGYDDSVRKIELLRTLAEYEKQGYTVSKKYTMSSSIQDMEIEHTLLKNSKTKANAVKLSRGFLINAMQALEFLNSRYDPIGMDLDGFSEIVSLSVSDYDEVLEELYDKYKVYGRKIEPELKLVLMISASATSFHASKQIINRIPGMEQQLKKNPSFINKLGKNLVSENNYEDHNTHDTFDTPARMKSRNLMSKFGKKKASS